MELHRVQMESGREPLPFSLLPCISLTAEESQQVKQALILEQEFNHGLCPAFSGFVIQPEPFLTMSLSTAQPLVCFIIYSVIQQLPDTAQF